MVLNREDAQVLMEAARVVASMMEAQKCAIEIGRTVDMNMRFEPDESKYNREQMNKTRVLIERLRLFIET